MVESVKSVVKKDESLLTLTPFLQIGFLGEVQLQCQS